MHLGSPDRLCASITSVSAWIHSQSFVLVCQNNSTDFSPIKKKPCFAWGRSCSVAELLWSVTEDRLSWSYSRLNLVSELWWARDEMLCGGSSQLKTVIIKQKHMFLKGQIILAGLFYFPNKIYNCMAVQLKRNTKKKITTSSSRTEVYWDY